MPDIQLTLKYDFADILGDRRIISASVGPAGEAVLMLADRSDSPIILPSTLNLRTISYPRRYPQKLDVTVLVILDGSPAHQAVLHDLEDAYHSYFPYHYIQPLPGGEILVVRARCWRLADGSVERNARIYSEEGELRRRFVLGDGIEDVQVTSAGDIWVSYFDEGIFNTDIRWGPADGWDGSVGLARYSRDGNRLWAYHAPDGVAGIDDCYALNVTSEAAWACYYSDFPLVRIDSDGEVRAWGNERTGARSFAVDDHRILFFGRYTSRRWSRLPCTLAEFGDTELRNYTDCRLVLPSGDLVTNDPQAGRWVIGRGPVLHVFTGTSWYQLDIREL